MKDGQVSPTKRTHSVFEAVLETMIKCGLAIDTYKKQGYYGKYSVSCANHNSS